MGAVGGVSQPPLTSALLEAYKPVIQGRHQTADDKAADEPVRSADQTARKRHPVPDEKLAEQRQMRSDDLSPDALRQDGDYNGEACPQESLHQAYHENLPSEEEIDPGEKDRIHRSSSIGVAEFSVANQPHGGRRIVE
jgi:hypothetical protein